MSFEEFLTSREASFVYYTAPFSQKTDATTLPPTHQPTPTRCHKEHNLLRSSSLPFHNPPNLLYLSSPSSPIHKLRNLLHARLLKQIKQIHFHNLFQNQSNFCLLQNILPLHLCLVRTSAAEATPGSGISNTSS